jgi:hypothetical protein
MHDPITNELLFEIMARVSCLSEPGREHSNTTSRRNLPAATSLAGYGTVQ